MEISIKNILDSKLRKDFQLNIPSSLLNEKVDEYLVKIQPEFSLDGYEKGKVPVETIKQQLGGSLIAEQSDIIISQAISKIVDDNNLRIASYPKIDFKTFEEGKDVDLIASFEIFPTIPAIDFSKITLDQYVIDISDEEINENVNKSLKSGLQLELQDSEYLSKLGDVLLINFDGNIDGESFDGSFGEEFSLELGSKTFIDNFEEQLVGKKINSKVEVKVQFPNDYFKPNLSGKKATFEVEILATYKIQYRKFDNAFVKEVSGFDDLESFKDAVRDEMFLTYDLTCRAIFKKMLFDYLDSTYKIDLPEGLVSEQSDFINTSDSEEPNESNNLALSQRMVRCGLILAEIANLNNISVTQEEIDNEIQNLVQIYPNQAEKILQIQSEGKSPEIFQGAILEEKVVNFILSKINLNFIKASPKEIDRIWFNISNK